MNRIIYIFLIAFIGLQGSLQAQLSINGQFFTANGGSSGEVDIEVRDADDNLVSSQFVACGDAYTISGLEANVNYTLHLRRDPSNPLNGVSTFDLVLMSKHILGVDELSLYQMLSGDADGDGLLTIMDMIEIRRLLLSITSQFPNNVSWLFVKEGNDFTSAVYDIQLTEDVEDYNFIVLKLGDVTGNYIDCE